MRTLEKEATKILKDWLLSDEHFTHPYPTVDERLELAKKAGITPIQVRNWFVNARKRIWRPMINEIHNSDDNYDFVRINGNNKTLLPIRHSKNRREYISTQTYAAVKKRSMSLGCSNSVSMNMKRKIVGRSHSSSSLALSANELNPNGNHNKDQSTSRSQMIRSASVANLPSRSFKLDYSNTYIPSMGYTDNNGDTMDGSIEDTSILYHIKMDTDHRFMDVTSQVNETNQYYNMCLEEKWNHMIHLSNTGMDTQPKIEKFGNAQYYMNKVQSDIITNNGSPTGISEFYMTNMNDTNAMIPNYSCIYNNQYMTAIRTDLSNNINNFQDVLLEDDAFDFFDKMIDELHLIH